MKKIFFYMVLFLLGGINLVSAQTASQKPLPSGWSLQDCIGYAKENNITLNSLKLSVQSTQQDLVLSKAAKLPSVSASATQSLANTSDGIKPASGYGLNSEVTLYNGGYLNNDIEQKQLLVQSAQLNVLQEQNDITLQITQAYYNIALAKENIVYVKDLVSTSEAQVKQGEQFYKAGTIAKKDLLQLQAVLANDQYNLVTAQNTEKQYVLNLKQILQLSSDTPFDIATPDTVAETIAVTPLSEAQQNALASRPEITNSKLAIDIANLDLEKAKASGRPTVTLGALVNTNYAAGLNNTYAKTLQTNLYQQVGVTLSVPIFNKKQTQVSTTKAKINIRQASLDAANTKTTLLQAVEQSYLNVMNAQGQYKAAEQQLSSASESYRIANEQLKIGSYNIVEYLQQRNQYVQALQSYVQAKYTTALYLKTYNFYNGVAVTQ